MTGHEYGGQTISMTEKALVYPDTSRDDQKTANTVAYLGSGAHEPGKQRHQRPGHIVVSIMITGKHTKGLRE